MLDMIGPVGKMLKATLNHAGDGFVNVGEAEYAQRLLICATCDQFDNNRCKQCTCYLPLKAKWRSEECPLGKWTGINTEIINNSGCGCNK